LYKKNDNRRIEIKEDITKIDENIIPKKSKKTEEQKFF